jgi:hypothetical protein
MKISLRYEVFVIVGYDAASQQSRLFDRCIVSKRSELNRDLGYTTAKT